MAAQAAAAQPAEDIKKLKPIDASMVVFTSERFPANCGANTISSLSLTNFFHYPAGMGLGTKYEQADWEAEFPAEFVAAMNKRWDDCGQGGQHVGNNLVAVTIPMRGNQPDKMYQTIDRILEATGWIKGMRALGSYGNTQQFWMRPGPKRAIKETT
jgi:hypothetical protein